VPASKDPNRKYYDNAETAARKVKLHKRRLAGESCRAWSLISGTATRIATRSTQAKAKKPSTSSCVRFKCTHLNTNPLQKEQFAPALFVFLRPCMVEKARAC
jgi:hypothetical protein